MRFKSPDFINQTKIKIMQKQLRKLLNRVKMARSVDQMEKITREAYDTLSNSELQILEQAIQDQNINYQQTANHDGRRIDEAMQLNRGLLLAETIEQLEHLIHIVYDRVQNEKVQSNLIELIHRKEKSLSELS
jgi:mevalonate kinase